jgi:hypothetical protein
VLYLWAPVKQEEGKEEVGMGKAKRRNERGNETEGKVREREEEKRRK